MPQDSTYVTMNPSVDSLPVPVPDTMHKAGTAHAFNGMQVQAQTGNELENVMLIWFFWLVVITVSLGLVFPAIGRRVRKFFSIRKAREVYDDKGTGYHEILAQYLPYYRSLSPQLQQRFIKRTVNFMTAKQFEYVGIEPEEKMPLLISATAIQLTFGLKRYLMDHFEKIYVLHHDYHYGLNSVPFQGHVNHEGIYLSWNNFTRGFENYDDGDNVGLHEMAHALAYVNFNVTDGSDDGFRERFIRFSKTGRRVFAEMQDEVSGGFLGHYAATRYEEFWAVCVEHFFERPVAFKIQLPELYAAMCELLNQDTLTPGILVPQPEKA
jgi:Mlc titration factor MtfA (ptsG expression regulator)